MTTEQRGLVLLITGDGKGKTTAALGLALRAIGHGQAVLVIQFMKGDPGYGEVRAAAAVPGLDVVQSGLPTFVKRGAPGPRDLELARAGMERARQALASGHHQLVVLDEINVAVDYGLLSADEVVAAVERRAPQVSVVLTGRYAPQRLIDLADTVSEVVCVKHHYDDGTPARAGIEY